MGQHSQELEKLFRKLAEQYHLNPSGKILRKLRFRLWVSDFFSFSLRKVNFIYSLLFIGSIATGLYYFQQTDLGKQLQTEEPVAVVEKENIKTEIPGETLVEAETPAIIVEDDTEAESESMLSAMFDAEILRGCAPLHVRFSNKSVMADSWQWDFGNGDFSNKRHPEYTYKTPGHYSATLTVRDKTGHEDVFEREIVVLKTPIASLNLDKDNSAIADRKIIFKNTSEGASEYNWDFGDGIQSEAAQPAHVYHDFGVYNVTLIAKASNGCADTAMLVNKFINQNYELSFPQTFKPNPFDRSNNGFYENAGSEAYIFYPMNAGAEEYNLTIYTSKGNKVFETDNIKQGWNGYFGGSLVPGGNYNYVVRGVYPNGKRFEIKGSVKVIIEDYYYKF